MEDLDEIALLDALSTLLSTLSRLIRYILIPLSLLYASVYFPVHSSSFFYLSTILGAFFVGVLLCRGPAHGVAWAAVIIVVCASVLSVRMSAHVEHEYLTLCSKWSKECELELVRVMGKLMDCREEAGKMRTLVYGYGGGGWSVKDQCMNPAARLVGNGLGGV